MLSADYKPPWNDDMNNKTVYLAVLQRIGMVNFRTVSIENDDSMQDVRQDVRHVWRYLFGLFILTVIFVASPAWAVSISTRSSTVVASPTTVIADGIATSTITVFVAASKTHVAVPNVTVKLTAGSGSSIISPFPSAITNSAGVATFTVKDAVVQSVIYTAVVSQTGSNTTISTKPTVNFVRPAPTAIKSFAPTTIAANATSTLTITLTNPNTSSITGVSFTDSYPTNLKNASTPALSNSCGGTATGSAGGASLALSNGTIPASGSCTLKITVTAATAASYVNSTGTINSTNATAGTAASGTLTVTAISAANSTVTASPTTVLANGSSTSLITVTLKDGAGLAVSGKTVTLTKGAGSSTVSAASGTSDTNGVVTFTVKNTVAETTTYTAKEVSGNITLTQTAAVTFVTVPILKTFSISPIAANETSLLTVTLTNSTGSSVSGAGFSDTYPVGIKNAAAASTSGSCGSPTLTGATGGSALGLSNTTIAANSTCTVNVSVTSATANTYVNTATNTSSSTSTASLVVRAISPTKSTVAVSPTSVLANGTSFSTITVSLKDGASNAVPGKIVTLAAATGSSVITPVSNVGGVAIFKVTDTTAEGPIIYTATDTTDNIVITQTVSVTFTQIPKPTVTKIFSPVSIADNGVSTLVITLTNPNTVDITDVDFSDVYPLTGELANTAPLVLTNTCGGANSNTVEGGVTLTLVGGVIPASGSCSVSVQVTAAFPGATVNSPIVNATGIVTSANAADGVSASATLTVVDVSAADSTVVASPLTVAADNATTSTITVTLVDGAGTPVEGKDVSLVRSSGSSSTITVIDATTDAAGVATFTVKDAVAETVTYTATDTTDNIVIFQQAVVTFVNAVGSFNAYETSTSPATAASGVVQTKVAGSTPGFSLDLVAINSTKTGVLTTFTQPVKVELIGNTVLGTALDASNCPTTFTTIQSPLFTINPTITNGRSTVTFPAISDAWRDVRVRISYPATGTPSIVACSSDNFAIRPASLSVLVQDGSRTTAGTTNTLNNKSITATPVHQAGSPFTITTTAFNAAATPVKTSNYAGSPTASLSACTGTACTGTPGALALGVWSGSGIVTTTASYNDVGAFTLQLQDVTFASVDATDGTPLANRTVTGSVDVGRFVPDHFDLSAGVMINRTDYPTCGITPPFTYTGETLGATFRLTACNSTAYCAGLPAKTTSSYAGSIARLTSTNLAAFNVLGATSATAAIGLTGGAVTGNWSSGVLDTTLSAIAVTRTTPHAPYTTFQFGIAPTDLDGVALAASTLTMDLDGTPGNDHAPLAGTTSTVIRFGRLKVANAYGSELLVLPIPMEAQYWNGTAFDRNTLDNCTSIAARNIIMSNYLRNLGPSSSCKTAASINGAASATVGAPFISGRADLRLVKPGPSNNGSVDLTVNLAGSAGNTCVSQAGVEASATAAGLSYLQGNWSATSYDQNPVSRATFGIYKNGPVIYMREMY